MPFWRRSIFWEGSAHGRDSLEGASVLESRVALSDSRAPKTPSIRRAAPPSRQGMVELEERVEKGWAVRLSSKSAGRTEPRRWAGTSIVLWRRNANAAIASVARSLRSDSWRKGNACLSHQQMAARRTRVSGQPSSPAAQSQSLSGCMAMFWPDESVLCGAKRGAKLPNPEPRTGWRNEKDSASL